MKKAGRGIAGFTLLELLTVIAIIGVLMALLIPVIATSFQIVRRNMTHER